MTETITLPLEDLIDEDAHIRPFLVNALYKRIFDQYPWILITVAGKHVTGPYIPLDTWGMIRNFMGYKKNHNRRRGGFVCMEDGEVMGIVLIETILDYITALYGRFESREIFNLLITNQLLTILEENGGTPITTQQIESKLSILRPEFENFDQLLEVVNLIANGNTFRFQFIDE